jgi:hypothetical protein
MKKILTSVALSTLLISGMAQASSDILNVKKSPSCGCCGAWIDNMKDNGFKVNVENVENMNIVKQQNNIAQEHQSCHTATINGYVVEGHVSAKDIRNLLAQSPDVDGISVPGMPVGSPGMEYNNMTMAYDSVLFKDQKTVKVFNSFGQ